MKKCPYCAEEIQEDAKVCRFCNRELEAAQVEPGNTGRRFFFTDQTGVIRVEFNRPANDSSPPLD